MNITCCVSLFVVQIVIKDMVLDLLLHFTTHREEEVQAKALMALGRSNTPITLNTTESLSIFKNMQPIIKSSQLYLYSVSQRASQVHIILQTLMS